MRCEAAVPKLHRSQFTIIILNQLYFENCTFEGAGFSFSWLIIHKKSSSFLQLVAFFFFFFFFPLASSFVRDLKKKHFSIISSLRLCQFEKDFQTYRYENFFFPRDGREKQRSKGLLASVYVLSRVVYTMHGETVKKKKKKHLSFSPTEKAFKKLTWFDPSILLFVL